MAKGKDGDYFAPKPLRTDTPAGKLLASIDLSECMCPMSRACMAGTHGYPEVCPGLDYCRKCPPALNRSRCKHVAAMEKKLDGLELTLDQLHAACVHYDPFGYAEPPRSIPGIATRRESRIALYQARASARRAIFHPDDIVRQTDGCSQGGSIARIAYIAIDWNDRSFLNMTWGQIVLVGVDCYRTRIKTRLAGRHLVVCGSNREVDEWGDASSEIGSVRCMSIDRAIRLPCEEVAIIDGDLFHACEECVSRIYCVSGHAIRGWVTSTCNGKIAVLERERAK